MHQMKLICCSLICNHCVIIAGVLGVAGGPYGILLPRSSDFTPYVLSSLLSTSLHSFLTPGYLPPLRFSLKAVQLCPISVQLSTSKRDAYFKLEVRVLVRYIGVLGEVLCTQRCSQSMLFCPLQILDHEQPVAEVHGKGHAVIPVHTLRPNHSDTVRDEVSRVPLTPLEGKHRAQQRRALIEGGLHQRTLEGWHQLFTLYNKATD